MGTGGVIIRTYFENADFLSDRFSRKMQNDAVASQKISMDKYGRRDVLKRVRRSLSFPFGKKHEG
jgi:hypothetical protein